ncbi:MAG: 2-amino-4-hydroxy-6-hydroxymethyldihydropteridine diphosphokinase [Chromatiales bacterium]|nr:MAG: 2-amino-4-hydroxy-6-hydroxymethyldihydropteridine diphosphokinase [Chromatiales bacterium]
MTRDERRVSAWVGIGSNLDDPEYQVRRAFVALAELPDTELRVQSPLYRTAPMGPQDQPDYINAVAELDTGLEADALLAQLQAIEKRAGRLRETRWGPRVLDLDLLTYGRECISRPGLKVPHPGIGERNFVLLPLLSVAPDLEIPGLGPVRQLAAGIDREGVERLE